MCRYTAKGTESTQQVSWLGAAWALAWGERILQGYKEVGIRVEVPKPMRKHGVAEVRLPEAVGPPGRGIRHGAPGRATRRMVVVHVVLLIGRLGLNPGANRLRGRRRRPLGDDLGRARARQELPGLGVVHYGHGTLGGGQVLGGLQEAGNIPVGSDHGPGGVHGLGPGSRGRRYAGRGRGCVRVGEGWDNDQGVSHEDLGAREELDHAKMLNGSRLKVRAPRENLGQRRCSGLARGLPPLLNQIRGHLMRTGYAGGRYEKIESLCRPLCAPESEAEYG